MPTRVTSEAIVKLTLVRILANGRAHELPGSGRRFQALHTANDVFGQVIEVGLAPGQEIGSRFSEQVLHAIGNEPSANDGEGEAKQAGMELPQLALPDQRLWCPNRDRGAGNENETDDGDNDDGAKNADDDEQPDGDCLLDGEGEAAEAVSSVSIRDMQEVGRASTYAMLRSSSENGRLFGVMSPKTYPMPPKAARTTQSKT